MKPKPAPNYRPSPQIRWLKHHCRYELRQIWSRPETRKALIEGLAEKGYGEEQLTEISRLVDAEKSDLYDVLAYIAHAAAPISRIDRVIAHKSLIFSRYVGKQQED
jgi:type I restriction enzyme, R subunit